MSQAARPRDDPGLGGWCHLLCGCLLVFSATCLPDGVQRLSTGTPYPMDLPPPPGPQPLLTRQFSPSMLVPPCRPLVGSPLRHSARLF